MAKKTKVKKKAPKKKAPKKPTARVESVEAALAVLAHEAVDCYVGEETGKRKQPSKLTSLDLG